MLLLCAVGFLYRYAKFVCNRLKLVIFSPICTLKMHSSYRTHYINHLAAYGTSLLRSQVAVVALLQIDAHLLWCVFTTKIVIFLRSIHTKVCYF